MVDPRDGESDRSSAEPSPWDREPDLLSLEIVSWEHAARVPGSWGKADRVANLQRLLPHKLTEPIYKMMAQAEALFLRRTEPLPPFQERLARDFLEGSQDSESAADTTAAAIDRPTLETELHELLSGTLKLGDVVPDWDKEVAAAVGADAAGIARSIRDFGSLGPVII